VAIACKFFSINIKQFKKISNKHVKTIGDIMVGERKQNTCKMKKKNYSKSIVPL
jgi:hypothetical protein